jgi:hypothetical protein
MGMNCNSDDRKKMERERERDIRATAGLTLQFTEGVLSVISTI